MNNKILSVGTKVIVQRSKKSLIKLKEKYINQKGEIFEIKDTRYRFLLNKEALDPRYVRYILKFENPEIQMQNCLEGNWLWTIDELIIEPIINRNRPKGTTPSVKVIGNKENYKIIINPPTTLYIINDGNNIFRGTSKCLKNDTFNRDKGIEIAKLRAEITKLGMEIMQKEYRLKQLTQ